MTKRHSGFSEFIDPKAKATGFDLVFFRLWQLNFQTILLKCLVRYTELVFADF